MKKLFAVVFCLLLLGGCTEQNKEIKEVNPNYNQPIVYETFHIEGMSCMKIGLGVGNVHEVWGITCNWDQWDGNSK